VVAIFLAYFLAALAVVVVMFERTRLLRLALYVVRSCCARGGKLHEVRLRTAHIRNEEAKLRSRGKETSVGLQLEWQAASDVPRRSGYLSKFEVAPPGASTAPLPPARVAEATRQRYSCFAAWFRFEHRR